MINKNLNSNFQISFETLVLKPVVQEGKLSTLIIEQHQEFIIPLKPNHIVQKSFSYYGRSLKNAKRMSKQTLGNLHKLPVVIANEFNFPVIFLPTMAHDSPHTVWISLHAIDGIKSDKMGCVVTLENGRSLTLNASAATIYRQYSLGSLLKKNLRKKRNGFYGPDFIKLYEDLIN